MIASISYRCTFHSLCYYFAYFYPLLRIVEFLVLFYDLECRMLECPVGLFVSAAGCHCFDFLTMRKC